jgi:hypothetical protein
MSDDCRTVAPHYAASSLPSLSNCSTHRSGTSRLRILDPAQEVRKYIRHPSSY